MKGPGWDGKGALRGHGLQGEGKPYVVNEDRDVVRVSGIVGRGLCACGWLSDLLDGDAARQRAHRVHKRAVDARAEGRA